MTGRDFDLVVVGAGVLGATTARLASLYHPQWRILIVDRGFAGGVASGASAGLDVPLARNAAQHELVRRSRELAQLLRRNTPGLNAPEVDTYWIARDENAGDLRKRVVDGSLRPATTGEAEHLESVFGRIVLASGEMVYRSSGSRYGSPASAARTMVRAYASPTRQCWEGTHVQTYEPDAGGFTLGCADGRTIHGARLVVAPGAWITSSPWAEAGGPRDIRIKKVAALHVDRVPAAGSPVLMFFEHDSFLLPRTDERRWVLSFASDDWDCPPEPSRLTISSADRAKALSVLGRYVPGFAGHVHSGRVFCDAYASDRAPVVAPLDGPATALAGACSGSGYRFAPGLAEQALELAGAGRTLAAAGAHGEAGR